MSLMSLQVFVLCAEFAHTQTRTHAHTDKDTLSKGRELEGNGDEEQAVFADRKGQEKEVCRVNF